jgi:hypothetical protein
LLVVGSPRPAMSGTVRFGAPLRNCEIEAGTTPTW